MAVEEEMEVDDALVEKFLTSLGRMAKREYTKMIGFEISEDNYIAIVDVIDDKEEEGRRVETKIISREYFDEICDSGSQLKIVLYGDDKTDGAQHQNRI